MEWYSNNPICLADIRHPEELSLLRKPRDPKKKKKKLEEFEEETLELEGPLLTPGSGTSVCVLYLFHFKVMHSPSFHRDNSMFSNSSQYKSLVC